MSGLTGLSPAFDLELTRTLSDGHSKVLFDYFAYQVDNGIQNALFAELMGRYADVSRELEEKNRTLKQYNEHLEELVQNKVKEISALQMATIYALVKAAEARDDDTGAHIERTSSYCRLIAENIRKAGLYENIAPQETSSGEETRFSEAAAPLVPNGLTAYPGKARTHLVDDAFIENISNASPLHDIGKIGVRDAILLKQGRLTEDEFEMMKLHVAIGYETLASVERFYPGNMFLKTGMEIAMYHHEKWDGSGYMHGLAGEDIPLAARIMALSDVYDALRSKRVYKEAYTHERSVDIIAQGRGTHFDPALVDIFFKDHLLFRDIFNLLSQE